MEISFKNFMIVIKDAKILLYFELRKHIALVVVIN